MEADFIIHSDENEPLPVKIPRPANAFMLYANKNRKRMALMYPQESNKEISKRLGISWKALDASEKKKYFEIAKTVDAEHKRKYPDYVYNPKEARIRKAMREASRERVVGTAPIPSPRGGRRSQTWTSSPEEQLMMAPSSELGGTLCGNPIFAVPTSSVSQFMQPINSYTKLVHVLPTTGWLQESPTYMQHNPMADLQQHQANMWQQYQEPVRSCSGPTYMLDSQVNIYHDVNSADLSSKKKCNSEEEAFSSSGPCNETALPLNKIEGEKGVKNEKTEECSSEGIECERETPRNSCDVEQAEKFVPVYQETVVVQNPFDKEENEVKPKKDSKHIAKATYNSLFTNSFDSSFNQDETSQVPNYNITHYIAPPECPLAVPLPSDSSPAREPSSDLHVKKIDCNMCQNNSSTKEGKQQENNIDCSNYRNYPFSMPIFHDHCNVNLLLMNNCNPNLIYTDVGVIPMYDNDADVDRLLNIATTL